MLYCILFKQYHIYQVLASHAEDIKRKLKHRWTSAMSSVRKTKNWRRRA